MPNDIDIERILRQAKEREFNIDPFSPVEADDTVQLPTEAPVKEDGSVTAAGPAVSSPAKPRAKGAKAQPSKETPAARRIAVSDEVFNRFNLAKALYAIETGGRTSASRFLDLLLEAGIQKLSSDTARRMKEYGK